MGQRHWAWRDTKMQEPGARDPKSPPRVHRGPIIRVSAESPIKQALEVPCAAVSTNVATLSEARDPQSCNVGM